MIRGLNISQITIWLAVSVYMKPIYCRPAFHVCSLVYLNRTWPISVCLYNSSNPRQAWQNKEAMKLIRLHSIYVTPHTTLMDWWNWIGRTSNTIFNSGRFIGSYDKSCPSHLIKSLREQRSFGERGTKEGPMDTIHWLCTCSKVRMNNVK